MTKFYSINELCRLTRVSVRTLHHYDKIHLLKPHFRTEKGHRRYSHDNLLQLQQIVTLKYIGFSLPEIKKILGQQGFNIVDSLKIQEKMLLEQITCIQKITQFINYLIVQFELNQPIDWKIVIQMIEVLKQNNTRALWYEKYLTTTEQQQYQQYAHTREDKWQVLFDEAKKNVESKISDEKSIELIKKWVTMANESYGDYPELIHKLWEAFKAGIIPSQLSNDKKIIAYVANAFEKLKRTEWHNEKYAF